MYTVNIVADTVIAVAVHLCIQLDYSNYHRFLYSSHFESHHHYDLLCYHEHAGFQEALSLNALASKLLGLQLMALQAPPRSP